MLFYTLIIIQFIALGAVYGRINGGGIEDQRLISRIIIMSAFVLACSVYVNWWALFAFLGMFGIATGHGQYFLDRQLVGQKERVERLDFIVKWIFGKDWRENYSENHKFTEAETEKYYSVIRKPLYWRNVFGMFLTGSLVGLPSAVIMLCIGQYIPAVLFACTGIAKALAYIIGDFIQDKFSKQGTVIAEYLNGGLRNALCLLVML